jgi:hypothetical protein
MAWLKEHYPDGEAVRHLSEVGRASDFYIFYTEPVAPEQAAR